MKTIRQEVLNYLEGCQAFVWGGTLSREVAYRTKHKEGIVDRELRRMVEENLIDVEKAQVEGKGPFCNRYKTKKSVRSIYQEKPQTLSINL